MKPFDPSGYGPAFSAILTGNRRRALDCGTPEESLRPQLERLSVASAFAEVKVADQEMAMCCLSGVWLLYDFLDESHELSQDIDTASGSFWHGIMHRREGDFGNSKYWFRRVGVHPLLERMGQAAAEHAAARGDEQVIKKLTTGGVWDPLAFVDLCESAVRSSSTNRDKCMDLQQLEWELLFDHCYQQAIAVDRAG